MPEDDVYFCNDACRVAMTFGHVGPREHHEPEESEDADEQESRQDHGTSTACREQGQATHQSPKPDVEAVAMLADIDKQHAAVGEEPERASEEKDDESNDEKRMANPGETATHDCVKARVYLLPMLTTPLHHQALRRSAIQARTT